MSEIAAAGLVLAAVAGLLILVLGLRLHAFLSLLLVSLGVAVVGGIPPAEIAGEIQRAMGGTLGYIAIVIGIGAIFGEMLRRSGGAEVIANTLLETFGEERAPTALGLTGLLVAIPVFFDVAFILLVPILKSTTRRTGKPIVAFAIPLLAGLAVAHAFVPPTPGPVAVAGLLGADLGWVIGLGLLAGLPSMVVGGLLWGRWLARHPLPRAAGEATLTNPPDEPAHDPPRHPLPSFTIAAALIALPLVAILMATVSGVLLEEGRLRSWLQLLGHPFTALLATTLLASWLLSRRCGWSRRELEQMATAALQPVGLILLLTGAGGVLGKTLLASGAGEVLARSLAESGLPLLLLAFVLALAIRVAQGSATVSMVTAAGLIAPIVASTPSLAAPKLAAITIAIAAGATACSHVNDSGFWLVSRYLGLSETETLRSWTVATFLVGATGLTIMLLINPLL